MYSYIHIVTHNNPYTLANIPTQYNVSGICKKSVCVCVCVCVYVYVQMLKSKFMRVYQQKNHKKRA